MMQEIRKGAVILAALLAASTPALAAQQCVEVQNEKYADTAHCFLRIDGKIIINRTCDINISGDLRAVRIGVRPSSSEYFNLAAAVMDAHLPDRPVYGYFCPSKKCGDPDEKGSKLLNYGRVFGNSRPEHLCIGNKRFYMCISQPYLICDPQTIKAWSPKEGEHHTQGDPRTT